MKTDRRALLRGAVLAAAALPMAAIAEAGAMPAPERTKSFDSKLMGKAKFIDVGGIRTRYFDAGKGPTMVLIHGGQWPATTAAETWSAIFDHLADRFHVYAFDKLGMGFTDNPKTDADYSMDAVVRHAAGFIDALGLKKIILAGHSRGALPAARIAVDHPELVSHLIILDTNALASDDIKLSERPDPPPQTVVPTRESIRQAELASVLSYRKDFLTSRFIDAEYRIASLPKIEAAGRKFRELRDQWIRNNPEKMKENPMLGNNMGSVVWWMIDCKHETIAKIKAGGLKAPTVIIWGWNDPFAPYSLALSTMDTISKVVERTEMHFVNHASHFVYSDQPIEVARLIENFVFET